MPGVGIAAAVEIDLRQRIGLQRRTVVLGIDQDNFETGVHRLGSERVGVDDPDSDQKERMHRKGNRQRGGQNGI